MQILPATDPTSITQAIQILTSGGVVAHATETCYGLACDLRNAAAVEKLFRIKDRPADQPVSALFPSIDAATAVCEFSDRALEIAKKHLPGPLTIIVPVREGSTLFITADSQPATEVGVRVSSDPLATELALRSGVPLATTSANVHGQSNPYSLDDLRSQFEGRDAVPDLILDSGTIQETPPSTVIKVQADAVTVLRQGSLRL